MCLNSCKDRVPGRVGLVADPLEPLLEGAVVGGQLVREEPVQVVAEPGADFGGAYLGGDGPDRVGDTGEVVDDVEPVLVERARVERVENFDAGEVELGGDLERVGAAGRVAVRDREHGRASQRQGVLVAPGAGATGSRGREQPEPVQRVAAAEGLDP